MSKTVITPKIEAFIIENYLKHTSREIAAKFGISKGPVLAFLKSRNLQVPREIVAQWQCRKTKAKPYSEKQKQFIRDNIETKSIYSIARSLKTCKNRLRIEITNMGFADIVHRKMLASRIQKGNVPPSKGKKLEEFMTPETLAKFRANQYKKDHDPHNSLPVGSEITRNYKNGHSYVFIKVEGERRLKLKHRHIWETYHREKIPKECNIIFKDGNASNFKIENLECITNTELMGKNTIQRYPIELKQQMNKIAKLKRTITKIEKNAKNTL